MGVNLKLVVDSFKTEPHYGLEKLPDDILLKYANIEIGQLKSYIQELEDKLKGLTTIDKTNQEIVRLTSEVNELKNENKRLKKRKGPASGDVNIVLSYDDKLRLREIEYRNDFIMIMKKEHDKFKVARDKLKGENDELKCKNNELKCKVLELQMHFLELCRKN